MNDLSDDETANENQSKQIKRQTIEKFFAQRRTSMPPPPPPLPLPAAESEKVDSSNINEENKEQMDEDDEYINKENVGKIKTKCFAKASTQRTKSASTLSTFSKKISSSQMPKVIDLTDDDDDGDFLQSKYFSSQQSSKKIKLT